MAELGFLNSLFKAASHAGNRPLRLNITSKALWMNRVMVMASVIDV